MLQRVRGYVAAGVGLAAGVGFGASQAMAQADPPAVTITDAIDVQSLGTTVAAVGGGALVVAFGVGGGFKLAKKAYGWIFAKI